MKQCIKFFIQSLLSLQTNLHKLFLLSFIVFILLLFLTSLHIINELKINSQLKLTKSLTSKFIQDPILNFKTYEFHPINSHGVYSFFNVCIENLPYPITQQVKHRNGFISYNETKFIRIYNSFYRDGPQKLIVSGSAHSEKNFWDVEFTREPIPSTHSYHNTTAFFVVQTCPSNIHHFWIDLFVPLYCTIKQCNRLKPDSNNKILYRLPSNLNKELEKECYDKRKFQELLKSLYVQFPHNVFYQQLTNTCYSSGVFGLSTHYLQDPRKVVNHVINFFNISDQQNSSIIISPMKEFKICHLTFLRRSNRQILNLEELKILAYSMGFQNICDVRFDKIDPIHQIKFVSKSKILIGVHGAGLQWSIFMPENSHLIEIAWPHKFWPFYYDRFTTQYKIKHHKLLARFIKVNWTSYEKQVRKGNIVSADERIDLLKAAPKSASFDNVWKWADVVVDRNYFEKILRDVLLDI